MSDYRYSLDIYAEDTSSLDAAIQHLEAENIVPNILKIDFENRELTDGKPYLYLSTDSLMPYGSVKCWGDQAHELFFHDLSTQISNAEFVFSGENLDDPTSSRFKKAFRNGQFKEVYQDVFDLGVMLEKTPWREYGSSAIETDTPTNNLIPVVILTCMHQTKYGDFFYPSIHPNTEAAMAYIEKAKEACNFEPELDEFFGYDIDLQVLDLQTMTSKQRSAQSIDALLSNAEEHVRNSIPKDTRNQAIDPPIR